MENNRQIFQNLKFRQMIKKINDFNFPSDEFIDLFAHLILAELAGLNYLPNFPCWRTGDGERGQGSTGIESRLPLIQFSSL